MSVPSEAEVTTGELGGAEADDSARLLTRFRSGDRAAGYELLGRQASIEQWKTVLGLFAADSESADLERIAGSTLGRHPDIVAAMIDLLEVSGSAQALFIAHATAELRTEPHIVERARVVEQKLEVSNRGRLDEGDVEQGLACLYTLLSQPLRAQQELWLLWREAAPAKAASVERALEAEDNRLQRLSKERSYRSGSYLHFLRHALADLVLVAGIDGPMGKRAFALLQRRVDDAERSEELLQTVPDGTRRRYLQWSLDARNADAVPRTRFALRVLREHFPAEASTERLLALCGSEDLSIALDAALTGIAVAVESRAFDIEVARLLGALDLARAQRLGAALAQAPARVELRRIAPARRSLLFADQAAVSRELCLAIARQLLELPPHEVRDVVTELSQLPVVVAPDEVFTDIARGLLEHSRRDESYGSPLIDGLSETRLRTAAWALLPSVDEEGRDALMRPLLDAEAPDARVDLAIAALSAVDAGARPEFGDTILAAVFDGTIEADKAAAGWPNELRPAALARAEEARRRSELAREAIEAQLRLGEQAYLADLRREMDPLIALAKERAGGNARLEGGYMRLRAALGEDDDLAPVSSREPAVAAASTNDVPTTIRDELSKVGATFDADTRVVSLAGDAAETSARLRYVGVLDQRAQRGDPPQRDLANELLGAYARALAEVGLAEQALRQLFEGGPLLPVVVQLSPSSRQVLLDAARVAGFVPPDAWFEHHALGEWLRTLQLRSGGAPSGKVPDVSMLATAFRLAQDASTALEAARHDLSRLHLTVKEGVARSAAPVFDEIDVLIDSYAQLWHGFAGLGIRQIAPLGATVAREEIDPARHEVIGEISASTFVVRSPGIDVDGQPVVRARLEGVTG